MYKLWLQNLAFTILWAVRKSDISFKATPLIFAESLGSTFNISSMGYPCNPTKRVLKYSTYLHIYLWGRMGDAEKLNHEIIYTIKFWYGTRNAWDHPLERNHRHIHLPGDQKASTCILCSPTPPPRPPIMLTRSCIIVILPLMGQIGYHSCCVVRLALNRTQCKVWGHQVWGRGWTKCERLIKEDDEACPEKEREKWSQGCSRKRNGEKLITQLVKKTHHHLKVLENISGW